MKSVLVLSLLMGLSAQAVMAPTGVHTTIGCMSTDAKKMKVYILRDTRKPNYVAIKLVTKEGVESVYKGKDVSKNTVGGSLVIQSPILAGMLTFSANLTSAPRPGGGRPGLLTSAAYGHAVKTPLMCSRVMY
jgi:hypothetical protein